MEAYYGTADRIWCGDRGMMSKENLEFMQSGNRKYIIGASKSTLKQFEQQLLQDDWQTISRKMQFTERLQTIRQGLEVKMCQSPEGAKETYILCRSQDRREKEKSMHDRFEQRIDAALEKLKAGCEKRN